MTFISINGNIKLSVPITKAFAFVANLDNDRLWRKEINVTKMSGEPAIGVLAEEFTYFSKKNSNQILQLECTEFIENELVIYTTVRDSPFYLMSIRKFTETGSHETLFEYEVCFDARIVKAGIGISLPRFIIQMGAQRDMKNYLKQLSKLLR